MNELDAVRLNFSQDNILLLNISLGFIMFGVAINLTLEDFRQTLKFPKSVFAGAFSQFILLPAVTFLMVWVLKPQPSVALGLILVAACPGGNVSNFISSLAKGNVALSVSLTAMSTVIAIVMTPFNLMFWGGLYEPTAGLMREISLDVADMFVAVVTILGIPIVIGMLFRQYYPKAAKFLIPYMQVLSLLIFAAFVILAFKANIDLFLKYIHLILLIVFIHNGLALLSGYQFARLFKLNREDCRTISIETGIQNSGLGLLLIFGFFDGLGGMAIVAAWWGIWHIISGVSLAFLWNRSK